MFQPVVARFVAEAEGDGLRQNWGDTQSIRKAIFRQHFGLAAVIGLVLTLVVYSSRHDLANWLNIPSAAVGISSIMIWLAFVRPVIAGMLQG